MPFYKHMKKYYLLLLAAFLSFSFLKGNHIAGGYVSYNYLGGNQYQIQLIMWRDCNSTTVFDGVEFIDNTGQLNVTPAILNIFNGSNAWIDSIDMGAPVVTTINPPTSNPCLTNTAGVCMEQGVYTRNYTFPSGASAFTIAYVRCCRNGSVTNLFDPSNEGAVYQATIPPTNTTPNSGPAFNALPPLFVCVNAPLVFDYSANDADGDVLRYSLCTPYSGGSPTNPVPFPPPNPPFPAINWQTGYSTANLLGGTPALAIDSVTGILTGTPNTIGQFVVGVCVSEYRNGVFIGSYLRDYQLNVTQCDAPFANIPSTDINPSTGIGTYVTNCNNKFVQFQNNSQPITPQTTYQWNFGDPTTTTDVSTQQIPSYTYPDTGTYSVELIVSKVTANGPCSDTTYALVKILPNGNADFNAQSVCPNSPNQFTDLSTTPYGVVNGWTWYFGDGGTDNVQNPVYTYVAGGTYNAMLVMTTDLGCIDTAVKQVFIYPGNNSDFSYTPPCIFQPVTFSLGNGSNVVNYNWTLSDGSTSTQPIVTYTYNTGGTFPVTLAVTSLNGCQDTTTKLITVQEPVTAVVDTAANACAGFPVQLNASGGLYYQWYPEEGLSDPQSSSPVATLDSNTVFTVVVSNDCFSDTTTALVIVRPLPLVDAGADTTIYKDTYASLHGTTDGVQYFWNPSTWLDEPFNLDTKAEPQETQWYELWAINQYGCSNKDSILITVEHYDVMDIPTGFSPNGDGVNDIFRIARWLNIAELQEFAVFNRWGQKIFTTNNIEAGWDGTANSKKADMGVYAWFVIARTADGKQLLRRGNVTLLR